MGYRLICRSDDEQFAAHGNMMEATYRHSI